MGAFESTSNRRVVAVIIPVLNERGNIEFLAERLDRVRNDLIGSPAPDADLGRWSSHARLRQGYDLHVVFIDDGSTDGTGSFLRALQAGAPQTWHLLERPPLVTRQSSRGSALRDGLTFAYRKLEADLYVEMDGDLSHRPEEIVDHLRVHEAFPGGIAISSKFASGSKTTRRSLGRRAVSVAGTVFMRLAIDPSVSDWTNGFRSYGREQARAVLDRVNTRSDPTFLAETLVIWLSRGWVVRDVTTTYVGRGEGLSKLRWRDIAVALPTAIRLGRAYRQGQFVGEEKIHGLRG